MVNAHHLDQRGMIGQRSASLRFLAPG